MQFMFIAVAIAGLLYFCFRKRTFDGASLAFLAACAYFLPGFFDVVPYASRGYWMDPFQPLLAETYFVMIVVLLALLASSMVKDATNAPELAPIKMVGMDYLASVILFMAFLGYYMTVQTVGWETLASPNKSMILENLNRWYTLWSLASALAVVVAFVQRRWIHMAIAAMFLGLVMYVGSRAEFAVTCIAIALIVLAARGEQRLLVRHWRAAIPVVALLAFILLFKIVSVGVKYDEPEFIVQELMNPETYYFAIVYSEPFYVQGTLNEVIANNFSVGLDHFSTLFLLAVPYAPELGLEPVGFNEIFQPALFPQAVTYGLASNVWAEMWSSGGWVLLLAFIAIFVAVLHGMSMIFVRASPELKAVIAVCMAYWGFYIHRNDLVFELVLLRNVLIIFLVSAVIARLIGMLRPMPRNAVREPS